MLQAGKLGNRGGSVSQPTGGGHTSIANNHKKQMLEKEKEIIHLKKQLEQSKYAANEQTEVSEDDGLQQEISDLQRHVTFMEKEFGLQPSGSRKIRLDTAKTELANLKEKQRSSMQPDKQYQIFNREHKQMEAKVLKARDALADARAQVDKWEAVVAEKHQFLTELVEKAEIVKENLKMAQCRLAEGKLSAPSQDAAKQPSIFAEIEGQIHSLVQNPNEGAALLALFQQAMQTFNESKQLEAQKAAAVPHNQGKMEVQNTLATPSSTKESTATAMDEERGILADQDISDELAGNLSKGYHQQTARQLLDSTPEGQRLVKGQRKSPPEAAADDVGSDSKRVKSS